MKKTLTALVLVSFVAVGGCAIVHKDHPKVVKTERVVVAPKPSLESLDARVTAIEHRLDAAKAYRARQRAAAMSVAPKQ